MRRKLLCVVLVLAMAAAVFAPASSTLAASAGDVRLRIEHDDWAYYGSNLWYGVYLVDTDGMYYEDEVYEAYMDVPCNVTLFNGAGEKVWASENYRLWDVFWGASIRFDDAAMKTWTSGMYTLQVEATIDGKRLSDSFTFEYEGWNAVEPEVILTYLETDLFSDGMLVYLEARATNAAGEPAQYSDVTFRLLNERGAEVRTYEGRTSINGWSYVDWTLVDGEDAYGTYTAEVSAKDSKGKTVTASETFVFYEKNKPQVITVEDPGTLAYYYGQYVELFVKVTDKDGKPAQYAMIRTQLLGKDGTPVENWVYDRSADGDGEAWLSWRLDDEDLPVGDYLLRITAGEATQDVSITYLGKVEPYAITPGGGVKDTYTFADEYLYFRVTGENGAACAYEDVLFEILNADGSPSDVGFIYRNETVSADWTDYDGYACVNLDFTVDPNFPEGDYLLRVTAGKISIDVPFAYLGKVKPLEITEISGVRDTYYYGEDVYLYFQVTGENGVPCTWEDVFYEILNADGSPSDVGIIWQEETTRWDSTDSEGYTYVNLYFPGATAVPEGSYLLRVTAGDLTKVFSFKVEMGELELTLEVVNYTGDDSSLLGYGDEVNLQTWLGYSGGFYWEISETLLRAPLHWWIVGSDGKTVYEKTVQVQSSYYAGSWFNLNEDYIPGIKGWKDGVYTIVAERTDGSVTVRGEHEFYFVGWNGAGEAANMIVELDKSTVEYGDHLSMTVTVTDANGVPVQGQYVEAYLRYPNGAPAYYYYGYEQSLMGGYLGATGTATYGTWFDDEYFDVGIVPSGTYVLVVRCGGLRVEKTITLTGFEGESIANRTAPKLTVTPDKTSYSAGDVMRLTFNFSGASKEIIEAYQTLGYLDIFAYDSAWNFYDFVELAYGSFSFEYFVRLDAEPGTYTVSLTTCPLFYGWPGASASFTIQYTGDQKDDPGTGGEDIPEKPGLLGDINDNGEVDATDYMLLKRAVLGTFKLTDKQEAVADINRDGIINAIDYMLLKRAVLGTYKIG